MISGARTQSVIEGDRQVAEADLCVVGTVIMGSG